MAGSAAYAAGGDALRVGLVGCGGRGTGAAAQALTADSATKLTAVGDMFEDAAMQSLTNLGKTKVKDQVAVERDHIFVGFDAYKQVIAACDVVLLATPPYFRPMHLRAAIEAGKHVFAEKPVAVDAPGVRHVLESAEMARRKNLSIVSGLCWRYDNNMIETVGRIHDGQIGDLVAGESTRFTGLVGRTNDRQPQWTEMEYQLRNWYFFTWLSGDFIVEQFVHELDKMAWILKDAYPSSVQCSGGRQARIGPNSGHIYDHFSAIFDYADGFKYYAATRHINGCSNVNQDLVLGTNGRSAPMKFSCQSRDGKDTLWRGGKQPGQMHQLEHDAFFAALRAGKIINNGDYMAKSTMMAIMARMSAYTGRQITWDQAMKSNEALDPSKLALDGVPPPAEVAIPGVTRFV
jgi:predicted dehydrogenase